MQLLPPKTVGEKKLVTFDFSADADPASTLSSPTVTKTLISGTDTNATALAITAVAVVGLTVQCLVDAGIDLSVYRLVARASASNNEIHELAARLIVRNSAS